MISRDHVPQGDWLTNVPCGSPGRRGCGGEIVAELDKASGHIVWHCPLCGDNGLIHGWRDTTWDRQPDGGAAPTARVRDEALTLVALTSTCEAATTQHAPSARPGFSVPLRECAQSSWVWHGEIQRFPGRI